MSNCFATPCPGTSSTNDGFRQRHSSCLNCDYMHLANTESRSEFVAARALNPRIATS